MESKTLRIAVLSDLHCHPKRAKYSDNSTYLFSDLLRVPSQDHPVEHLLEIIDESKLKVDLVLSPGDITDHADIQGFLSGWSYVNEISKALDCKNVIATIGNHDIDSRHEHSNYSFDVPKKIKQNFPVKDKELNKFWDDGFVFIEKNNFQILVIDSTHFHTHFDDKNKIENPAVKGKLDEGQIEKIKKYLADNNNNKKIKIALCHHSPVPHSRLKLGEHDFVENGNDLLSILGTYKFDLFIYGHKHDPWLRNHLTDKGYSIPMLSSGSFSATGQIVWAAKHNYFHIIEIIKKDEHVAQGTIQTWTYRPGVGWSIDEEDGFLPYTGFGYQGSINSILLKIKSILPRDKPFRWKNILIDIPEIENLTPDKMDELEILMKQERIIVPKKLGLRPRDIYYDTES